MRLGMIARADNSGLGIQTYEFARHMKPQKTLVIDVSHLANTTSHCNKSTHLDRFPGSIVHRGWEPSAKTIATFLDGLDVVYTAETPYSPYFMGMATERGIKTVIAPNYEFFDRDYHPDLLAVPTLWHFDDFPEPKVHLPVPIALDRWERADRQPQAGGSPVRHFLHVVGRPAVHDRNGTTIVLDALVHVREPMALTLRCQDVSYLQSVISSITIPDHVTITVGGGDVRDYWDLYRDGDVMLMPRRYGGLCLPAQEAIGAGMPVIMPDVEPNNSWLPAEWLVEAFPLIELIVRNRIMVNAVTPENLAAKMDEFASPGFYAAAVSAAQQLAHDYSWDSLRAEYDRTFRRLIEKETTP